MKITKRQLRRLIKEQLAPDQELSELNRLVAGILYQPLSGHSRTSWVSEMVGGAGRMLEDAGVDPKRVAGAIEQFAHTKWKQDIEEAIELGKQEFEAKK